MRANLGDLQIVDSKMFETLLWQARTAEDFKGSVFHGGVIKKEIEALHSVALDRLSKSNLLKVVKYEDTVMEKVLEKEVVVKRVKKKKSIKKLDKVIPKKEEELPKLIGAKSPNRDSAEDRNKRDLSKAVKD